MRLVFKKTNDTYIGIEVLDVDDVFLFWRYLGESTLYELNCGTKEIQQYFTSNFGWKYVGKVNDSFAP